MLMTTTRGFTRRTGDSGRRGGGGPRAGAVLLEVAARLQLAGQGVAHDALGELAGLDHGVAVGARVHPQLLAEEDQVLGGHVARRTLVGREGAAAQARDRAVEAIPAHLP